MKKEIRVWWEEVAEQYEEWADEPPRLYVGAENERFTCTALEEIFGGVDIGDGGKAGGIYQLWSDVYKCVVWPIGVLSDGDRPEKRFHFCHYMAETIREYLETE